jgi:hypothetical protein
MIVNTAIMVRRICAAFLCESGLALLRHALFTLTLPARVPGGAL